VVSPNYSVKDIDKIPRDKARQIMGWDESTLILTHTGNMGLKQDLGNLIEAIKLVDSDNVRLMLVGDGSQRSELEELAGANPKIKFMDLVEENQYSALLSASDVLLLNEAPTITDMSLPSKLTSYEASGQRILGAVVTGGNTAKVLDKLPNAQWVVAGNPAVLAQAISKLVNDGPTQEIPVNASATNLNTEVVRNQRIAWVLDLIKK
jgi:glycosyltransferase involved in cell wall biosynthesis